MYSKSQKFNFDIAKMSDQVNQFISNVKSEYNKTNIRNNNIPNGVNWESCVNFSKSCFCINNGHKYYMIIVSKKRFIQNSNENILYIYEANQSKQINKEEDYILKNNSFVGPYFIETDNEYINTREDYLIIEGYIYGTKNNYTFLATDILFDTRWIVKSRDTCEYTQRYECLQDIIIKYDTTTKINGFINIGIHPVFETVNEKMISNVFKNSFCFKTELKSIEYFLDAIHKKVVPLNKNTDSSLMHCKEISKKRVEKTSVVEVYNVFNLNGTFEGILYIKTKFDSKKIRDMFKRENSIVIECVFNQRFRKFEITSV